MLDALGRSADIHAYIRIYVCISVYKFIHTCMHLSLSLSFSLSLSLSLSLSPSLYMYMDKYISEVGGETNREIYFGFGSRVRARGSGSKVGMSLKRRRVVVPFFLFSPDSPSLFPLTRSLHNLTMDCVWGEADRTLDPDIYIYIYIYR